MGFNPFKKFSEAITAPADRIVREEVEDPRKWETELNDQSTQQGQEPPR